MVSKKKSGKALGVEVAELSRFNEDFEEAMREFKEQLEAKRLERQKAFKEYEKQYQKAKDENYRVLGIELLKALGLDNFGSLKELMNDEENKKALSAKKDFAVLFEKNDKFIRKVFSFIANDELVRTALDEFMEEQRAKEEARLAADAEDFSEEASGKSAKIAEGGSGNASSGTFGGAEDGDGDSPEGGSDGAPEGASGSSSASYGLNFGGGAEAASKLSGEAEDEPVLL